MTQPLTPASAWQQYEWLENELRSLIGPIKFSAEINLRLERIGALLAHLGNPEKQLRVVHVGGTSGKGSTAVMIANILTCAGYNVGLHTSPHLQLLNERHQINGQMIPTSKLVALWQQMKPAIEAMRAEHPFGAPSYFEAQFALACLWFAAEKVDVAVIEVGLGGLLDATNILPPSVARVAVLTNVGLDHTDILGDTVELIAQDKVGIFKRGQIVVSGVKQSTVQAIVRGQTTAVSATLWLLGETFAPPQAEGENRWAFSLPDGEQIVAQVGLPGAFQAENGAVAVAAVTAVAQQYQLHIPPTAIQQGLKTAQLPGRLEQMQTHPTVILDGAHNPDKIRAGASVVTAQTAHQRHQRVITLLAIKAGKAATEMLPQVVGLSDVLVVTNFLVKGLWHSYDPAQLAAEAHAINPSLPIHSEPDPHKALAYALALAAQEPERSLLWVTGSLYLVGDVRAHWHPPMALVWALEQAYQD
jgi:dihydrofolate synthase / folylpolyglutamate synthase